MTRYEEIVLVFKKFAQQSLIDEGITSDVDLQVVKEIFGGQALRMVAQIMCEDLPPEKVTRSKWVEFPPVPLSAWHMWKEQNRFKWYARWIVKRWPVKYQERQGVEITLSLNLERFRAYPQAKIQFNDDRFGNAVRMHTIRDLDWREEFRGYAKEDGGN